MSDFQGFTEPNTTPTPNQFYDFIMADINNLAELKCVLYVIRRTYGFLKFVDRIAYSQFENGIMTRSGKRLDKGTGLSGPSISAGLNKAVDHGYLNRYVVCPSCQHEVTERAILEYSMKPRKGKGPVTVIKNVAPAKCPYCQNELRGKELLYYSLNFLHSDDLDYLKGLHGVYKDWKLGLSKLFNTQEKEVTRKRQQQKEKGTVVVSSRSSLSPQKQAALSTLKAAGVEELVALQLVEKVDPVRVRQVCLAADLKEGVNDKAAWVVSALNGGWAVRIPRNDDKPKTEEDRLIAAGQYRVKDPHSGEWKSPGEI